MPGSGGVMKNKQIILLGVVFIALLCSIGTVTALADNSSGAGGESVMSDDIAPYQGPISADSPLYGLKIAMEDLDETFTFNTTQRVEKQVDHARLRIAEVRRELSLNRTNTAERAMEQYRQKLNLTEMSLTPFASNATGLLHAQEMITRHQAILANLSLLYPNNTGLARAYNNSLSLERKFEQKTETRFARFIEKDNKTIFKAVRLEIRNQNRISDDNTTALKTIEQNSDKIRDRINNQNDVISQNRTTSPQNGNQNVTPALNKNPQEGKGSSRDTGKNGRN